MDAIEVLTALATSEGRADPYPLYAALHEMGEVIKAGPGSVVVAGYDAINSVLRDPGFRVSDEPVFDRDFPGWRANPVFVQGMDWILNLNAPRHPRIRSLMARAFTARRVAGLEPAIARMADDLLDAMADRGADGSAVEFMHDFAYLLPVTVICELIGIPEADREGFRPARFDPMRPDGGPLSFGGGAHFCIGAALARLEGAVAFPRLLSRFPKIAAAGEPTRRKTLLLRGFDALPVTVA